MISDSSPLIIFGKLNELELLKKVFGKIEIVESVYKEVVEEGIKSNKPESFIIKEYIDKGLISIKKLNKSGIDKSLFLRKAYSKLGVGEIDSIALALSEGQKEILVDEMTARKVAKLHGIKPVGMLRVILIAYKKEIIKEGKVKEIVDKAIADGFRVGADVINEFWKLFERMG